MQLGEHFFVADACEREGPERGAGLGQGEQVALRRHTQGQVQGEGGRGLLQQRPEDRDRETAAVRGECEGL